MAAFLVLGLCLAAGILARASRRLPESTPAVANGFLVLVSVPALTLLNIHRIGLDWAAAVPISMAWILFPLAMVFFGALGKLAGWSRTEVGSLILTGGLANTAFVGYPLLEALYGRESLELATWVDQPGSFLVVSTLGVAVAAAYSSRGRGDAENPRPSAIVRRIALFPPFLAMLAALALKPVEFPDALSQGLERLASPLAPLALFSIGYQLRLTGTSLRRNAPRLAAGLGFKLAVAPLLLWLLYSRGFRTEGLTLRVTVCQAAMAPMVTGAILAEEYRLEPELATLMVGLGVPISLLTVPLWARWLG